MFYDENTIPVNLLLIIITFVANGFSVNR